jgi:hypothetical protein
MTMADCWKCGRDLGEGRRTGCRCEDERHDQPTLDGYEPDAAHRGIFAALAGARVLAREAREATDRVLGALAAREG